MKKADGENAIISLERGLDLLRAFQNQEEALGIHDLMRITRLPKATVARLVYTLTSMGYLRQTHFHGRYSLADRVIDLGTSVLANLSVCRIATPILQDLADRFNMSAALGAGDRADMIYLAYCQGEDMAALRMRTGALVPMHTTAIGRAYLSALTSERRGASLEHIRQTGADMDEVIQRLAESTAQIDAVGFCTSLGDWRPEMYSAAAPLIIGRGETMLAINCGASRYGLRAEHFRDEVGPALRDAAGKIRNTMADMQLGIYGP